MGKTAIDAERGTIFRLDPNDVLVIGHDTQHKRGEHPLWQARALEPADEALAQHMAQHGFTSVIDGVKALRYALGELPPRRVAGLLALVYEVDSSRA